MILLLLSLIINLLLLLSLEIIFEDVIFLRIIFRVYFLGYLNYGYKIFFFCELDQNLVEI